METLIILGGSAGVGAIIFVIGFLFGRFVPKKLASARPPQPICGCDHGLNMHGTDGRCHEIDLLPVDWDDYHRAIEWQEYSCTCQKYVGPKPVEELFSTAILPPEIET
jgi:hypothetical protein